MTPNSDPQRRLRMSLAGNAGFSVLSGLVFALGSSAVASAIGLLGFAASIGWLASRPTIFLPVAMTLVWCELAWVAGTIPVVMAGVLSGTGNIAAVAVAAVVLSFALLQYLGIRRVRRLGSTG